MPGKVWNEITNPLLNFSGTAAEVWEWISNFIPHFNGCYYLSMQKLKLSHVSNRTHWATTRCIADPTPIIDHLLLRLENNNNFLQSRFQILIYIDTYVTPILNTNLIMANKASWDACQRMLQPHEQDLGDIGLFCIRSSFQVNVNICSTESFFSEDISAQLPTNCCNPSGLLESQLLWYWSLRQIHVDSCVIQQGFSIMPSDWLPALLPSKKARFRHCNKINYVSTWKFNTLPKKLDIR